MHHTRDGLRHMGWRSVDVRRLAPAWSQRPPKYVPAGQAPSWALGSDAWRRSHGIHGGCATTAAERVTLLSATAKRKAVRENFDDYEVGAFSSSNAPRQLGPARAAIGVEEDYQGAGVPQYYQRSADYEDQGVENFDEAGEFTPLERAGHAEGTGSHVALSKILAHAEGELRPSRK